MRRVFKKRKIIQIAAMVMTPGTHDLVALADDGTIWWCDFEIQRWFQFALDVEDEGGPRETVEDATDDLT